jgi:lipid II:glycine glycyltransferase (peptidoglycan interpeptide bridge formation enzyme)
MQNLVEIDRVTAAEWAELLELFVDANVYQTWSFGAVRWGERNLGHVVLKQGGDVAGIAQVRIVRVPLVGCGIAYLRWGPLCHRRGRKLNPEVLRDIAQALQAEYVERQGLFLRVLPNAFVGSARAEVFQTAFSGFKTESASKVDTYRTMVVDLSGTLDELRKRLDQKWRNQLNRAERNGLEIVEGTGMEEYRVFAEIYREMWDRKRFDTGVDVEEFGRIQQGLPESQRMRILICRQGTTPIAGIVCSTMGDTGIYVLGATSDAGLQSKGAYLLQWTMIRWLKGHGFQYYDLGGIDPESNAGVYHFKSGFSGDDVRHLAPFAACNSLLGSAFVQAVDFVRARRRRGSQHVARNRPQRAVSEALPGTEPVR